MAERQGLRRMGDPGVGRLAQDRVGVSRFPGPGREYGLICGRVTSDAAPGPGGGCESVMTTQRGLLAWHI